MTMISFERPPGASPLTGLARRMSAYAETATAVRDLGQTLAHLPFDALRVQYANSVKAGLIERSILASRDFEIAVSALERLTLGPLGRRV